MGMNKRQSQRLHAQRRSIQRTGIYLSEAVERRIIEMIQRGQAEFVRATSVRAKVFRINLDGDVFGVVYDNKRKSIATVLSEEMVA